MALKRVCQLGAVVKVVVGKETDGGFETGEDLHNIWLVVGEIWSGVLSMEGNGSCGAGGISSHD